jgi:hypothetical protein
MGRFQGILLAEDVGGTGLRSGSLFMQELMKQEAQKSARRESDFIALVKKEPRCVSAAE